MLDKVSQVSNETLFYMAQNKVSHSLVDPIELTKKAIESGNSVSIHNFMSVFMD